MTATHLRILLYVVVYQNGNTPLVVASLKGHEAAVKRLLKHGANIGAVDKVSETNVWIA